jgi:lipopolysaccharide/colanic/teichoic acid biosynthesis glycosyltransferase
MSWTLERIPGERDRLAAVAEQAGARTAYLTETALEGAPSTEINGPSLSCESAKTETESYEDDKRIFDVVVSSALLVLLAPVFLLIALLIRMSSPGPALFVQKRAGLNGRLFRMYKFRTMHCHAPRYEYSPKSPNDLRITGLGRLLRRTSLDELPQLLNVLLGQMSLVGPRPEMPFIVRRYNDHQRQRLQVIPGITGLWQLSRDRNYPIHDNLHHDLSYIRHRTMCLDVAILMHTLFFAMRGGI